MNKKLTLPLLAVVVRFPHANLIAAVLQHEAAIRQNQWLEPEQPGALQRLRQAMSHHVGSEGANRSPVPTLDS